MKLSQSVKSAAKLAALLLAFNSLTSCGLPTAAVRTANNAIKEATSLYDGTSSAYKTVN